MPLHIDQYRYPPVYSFAFVISLLLFNYLLLLSLILVWIF